MKATFDEKALAQYMAWQSEDRKTLKKINNLLKDILRNGVDKGIGQPEPLKYDLSGYWSRRIDEKNRLVYRIDENDDLYIESCKGHYDNK